MIREHLCGLTRGELVTWGASGVDLHVKPDLAYPQITTPFWPKAPLYIHIYTYRSSSDQIRDPLWVISKSGLTLVSTPLAPLVTLLKNFLNVTIIANQVISTRLIEWFSWWLCINQYILTSSVLTARIANLPQRYTSDYQSLSESDIYVLAR